MIFYIVKDPGDRFIAAFGNKEDMLSFLEPEMYYTEIVFE